MKSLILIIILFLVIISLSLIKKNRYSQAQPSLIQRFRHKFKDKNHLKQRLKEGALDVLLLDPNNNIIISIEDQEADLREKADIHRARLNKFGKSKLDGKMFFKDDRGEVFTYNKKGGKKYI